MVVTRSKSIPQLNGNGVHVEKKQQQQLDGGGHRQEDRVNGSAANGHVKQAKAGNGSAMVQPAYDPAPRTHHYEFLGPPGALGISVLVPVFTYFFAFGCDERGCPSMPVGPFLREGLKQMQTWQFYADLWDTNASIAYLAWYAWCVVCWAVLPGQWLEGTTLRNGEKLWYKINAFQTFVATMAAMGAIYFLYGLQPFLFAYDHWVGLCTASLLMSIVQATYCYAMSFIPGTMLSTGGNTGNVLYDWFIGRNLNPRIGIFDIKTFNELRPGLILWMILDICMAVKQYTLIGRITDSMILVQIFQAIYVFDAMYNEAGILTQMDITTDGFGFMLAVGDLLWVTFTYGLQTRYLALYPVDLGWFWTSAIVATNCLGYYIFRVSNAEKNDFRNGKNPKDLQYMKTERGTNLLTSGWWGVSRHPNYLGDWIMAWAWCLPTGWNTPITYYYVIYFGILLAHRQNRDDEACKAKYGKDWDKYCKIVKWKIIPGLY